MVPEGRKLVEEILPNGWNRSLMRSMVDNNALPGGWISDVTFQSRWKRCKFDGVLPDGWMKQYFEISI